MQQQGGSHHGAPPPETSLSFAPAEAASPLSSRPAPRPPASIFCEYGPGEEGGGPGNRWPRQETLALLKIRSEMDPAFRDATLKGPLWEDVSRKLAELGYTRSSKKCKEKFENVHKYYKRTKEGRAGRQDGKSYRFFSQLEALHSPAANVALIPTSLQAIQPPSATPPALPPVDSLPGRISFSSSTSSSSSSDSDGEETEEGGIGPPPHEGRRKRKRRSTYLKMMDFFDGLMKQMMERQEAMQNRFLETIEKREQDRLIREEAWKRQEMVRLNREHELMAQERAIAASRDAAVISFLQKFADNTPPPPPTATEAAPPSPEKKAEIGELVAVTSQPCSSSELAISPSSSSSRWPKPEVLALIRMRSGLETRYLEAGPKGPLWEEISLGMKRLGYSRNAKRCKEKWENINKYFKKVKESNKKRPEDAKTCPYFHELDALYRKKHIVVTGDHLRTPAITGVEDQRQNNQASTRISDSGSHETGEAQLLRSNGGAAQLFFGGASAMKKPEDIVRELMGQQIRQSRGATAAKDYEKLGGDETVDSDMGNHEYDDDEDYDDDEGDVKLRYEIQFQSQGAGPVAGGGARGGSATAASSAGSFLAMVQ